MGSLSNPFFGIDTGTLNTLKTKVLDAIQAVLLNQSYSLNGKSVNRADLDKLNLMLGQLQAAIDDANNESTTVSYVSFNGF
jgi:hypothetical protein